MFKNKPRKNIVQNSGINATVHKKNRRNNRNVIKTSMLPSIVQKNLQSARKSQTIKFQTTLTSLIGSNQILFTTTGANYWNIAQIFAASNTFGDNFGTYSIFKILSVKCDIQRIVPENNISTIYPSGNIPSFQSAFLPAYTSTGSFTPLHESSISFETDPFISIPQRVNYSYPPILAYNNTTNAIGSIHHYGMWNTLTSNYTNMPGQLSIQFSQTPGNALTNTQLFNITVYVDCEFALDYA
jgi:hypothetical protein